MFKKIDIENWIILENEIRINNLEINNLINDLKNNNNEKSLFKIKNLIQRNNRNKDRINDLQNRELKLRIRSLENDNFIQIPKECLQKLNSNERILEEFENLRILIDETNKSYKNDCFTAVVLLSRKFIINLCYSLAKKYGQNIFSDKKYKINEEYKVFNEKNFNFEQGIAWLFENRYLTLKDKDLLNKMRKSSNEIHHKIDVSKTKKDARKYFLTIKGIIESNFETKEINFDNEEIFN
ncbi:MAG: hypothetical protein TYPL_3760 [Candidatus Tyloplasma litorale]|nr:MAG: hypothetical protein TYPL_3760 [Mycoplasmatales bacterium]